MAAISHGKAILTSPPIVELGFLKSGFNVIWPEHPTIESFVKLAEKLLYDNKLKERLEKGAELLAQKFEWEKIASFYEFALEDKSLSNGKIYWKKAART